MVGSSRIIGIINRILLTKKFCSANQKFGCPCNNHILWLNQPKIFLRATSLPSIFVKIVYVMWVQAILYPAAIHWNLETRAFSREKVGVVTSFAEVAQERIICFRGPFSELIYFPPFHFTIRWRFSFYDILTALVWSYSKGIVWLTIQESPQPRKGFCIEVPV